MSILEPFADAAFKSAFADIYPLSARPCGGAVIFMFKKNGVKSLAVLLPDGADDETFVRFTGDETVYSNCKIKTCPLDRANAAAVRASFPFTNPVGHKGKKITVGLGDRLGLASPGHIRLIKNYDIFPVLAQQSIRELNLTGRTYEDVLDAATWAVLQEGYEKGYGADGDHLKTADEVRMALGCGYTMITLDCSEHIDNNALTRPQNEIDAWYARLPEAKRTKMERAYLDGPITLNNGRVLRFKPDSFRRIAAVYLNAVKFAAAIYAEFIAGGKTQIDFEMSIDETLSETSPEAHYFTANELARRGVMPVSLAPRFCGEFQKGIDYKGDVRAFEQEFTIHAEIAGHFGYKLSVHSGSDKFLVFGIVGDKTGGNYHLKTAGTNWLEALRVVADKDAALFRRIMRFAVDNLSEAKKYYHITENVDNIPDYDAMPDNELPNLLDLNDSRQVLHVTYGLILQAENGILFKDAIYELLNTYEEDYYNALYTHIGKHLNKLGL